MDGALWLWPAAGVRGCQVNLFPIRKIVKTRYPKIGLLKTYCDQCFGMTLWHENLLPKDNGIGQENGVQKSTRASCYTVIVLHVTTMSFVMNLI
jgi:hypothetical protein